MTETLWYPVWDAKLKLGHAVRIGQGGAAPGRRAISTPRPRCCPSATWPATRRSRPAWPTAPGRSGGSGPRSWLDRVRRGVDERHAQHGEVAFLLEPNLKEGRGGLRDVHALSWAALATDDLLAEGDEQALREAYEVLLAARVELHRLTGRPGDVLALQDQDAVAARLRFADADAAHGRGQRRGPHDLVDQRRGVVPGARRGWASSARWDGPGARRRPRRQRPARRGPPGRRRRPRRATRPCSCASATAAARKRLHIDRSTLERLAAEMPTWPDPWPAGASDDLVALLLEGHDAIPVLESLDQRDLITRLLPEWAPVRSRPQRNAYHRFTVDRHLWEAAANAAELADRVPRPDLLVLGALLHDLGKGYPGDHTIVGVDLVERIGHRLGLSRADIDVLATLVRHHLLLPDVATRRDLSDDGTIERGGRGRRLAAGADPARRADRGRLAGDRAVGLGFVEGRARRGARRPGRPRPRRRRDERRHLVAVPVRARHPAHGRGAHDRAGRGRPGHDRGPRPARPLQPGGRRAVDPRARRPRRPGPLGRAGHGGQRVPRAAAPQRRHRLDEGGGATWSGPSPGSWPSRPAWPSGPAPTAGGGRSPRGRPAPRCASTTRRRPTPPWSRWSLATASGSCTGSPRPSPTSASTSATPGCRPSGRRSWTPSTCGRGEGKVTDPYHLAELERALLHASEPGPG